MGCDTGVLDGCPCSIRNKCRDLGRNKNAWDHPICRFLHTNVSCKVSNSHCIIYLANGIFDTFYSIHDHTEIQEKEETEKVYEKELQEITAYAKTGMRTEEKNAKKTLLEDAIVFLYRCCVSGMRFYKEDISSMQRVFQSDILNAETYQHVYRLLLMEGNPSKFEDYVAEKTEDARRIYAKYFSKHIKIENGIPYSEILNMYWDQETETWGRTEDSMVIFTMFMPYCRTACA